MRYTVVATDYDGTLAKDGQVSDGTIAALERLRQSGRMVILVTGRELDSLRASFARLDLFDCVVAENGGLLFMPGSGREVALAPQPPAAFVASLRRAGVDALGVGHTIVSTRHPHETTVLDAIRRLGLELEIVFNKGAVMVLPTGVNKCTGLASALVELGQSFHNVVGVGDAENDHAFLRGCECAIAVSNALPSVKRAVDWTTRGARGAGVEELIERLLLDDLASLEPRLDRHHMRVGASQRAPHKNVTLAPYGTRVLVLGSSKAGKSSLTFGLLERLSEAHYQYCLIDPEGDYEAMPSTVNLGTQDRVPAIEEVLDVLERPDQNAVVCLLAMPAIERPAYFAQLLPRLEALYASTARPHWLVIDEVHHVLPAEWAAVDETLPRAFGGLIMVGLRAGAVARSALSVANTVVTVGDAPGRVLREFCQIVGCATPAAAGRNLDNGEAQFWRVGQRRAQTIDVEPAQGDRRRHRRKYAEGELPPERSFYFTGADDRLHLRAHNLSLFLQLADGVDDDTWLHHLRLGDVSRWVRTELKDAKLAERLASIEQANRPARESRAEMRAAIEQRYAPPG